MNVEELLVGKKIFFKRAGQRLTIRCLNPDHEDNNPSMSVDPITGGIHCFSCGYGKGTTLFQHFGIMNNERDMRVQQVLKAISKIRSPEISIPPGTIPFNEEYRDIKGETYKQHGVFTSFTDFKDSIVFPIRTATGKLVALVSRHMGTEHGSRYIMYPPSASVPFYPSIPKPYMGSIIIVEGIFDYLKMYDSGVTNGLALLGANNSRIDTIISALSILNVSRVILCLDNDVAGIAASKELKYKLSGRFPIVDEIDLSPFGIKDIGSASPSLIRQITSKLYENCVSPEMPS